MISKSQEETEVSFRLEEWSLEAWVERRVATTVGDACVRPRRQPGQTSICGNRGQVAHFYVLCKGGHSCCLGREFYLNLALLI